jgi:hypothetical protein
LQALQEDDCTVETNTEMPVIHGGGAGAGGGGGGGGDLFDHADNTASSISRNNTIKLDEEGGLRQPDGGKKKRRESRVIKTSQFAFQPNKKPGRRESHNAHRHSVMR